MSWRAAHEDERRRKADNQTIASDCRRKRAALPLDRSSGGTRSGSIAASTHRLVGDGLPKNEGAHEATCVDHCTGHITALGNLASDSAGRYRNDNGHLNRNDNGNNNPNNTGHLNRHDNGHFNRPNDRRYLHRGNNGDVLQRTHRSEYEWLRNERRDRVEQCVRLERRGRGGQLVRVEHHRRRWQQRIVHSALFGVSVGKRTVQLTSPGLSGALPCQ
jgi:hypothetical protein